MKKIFIFFSLFLSAILANAQNGLEQVIVEKFYVANGNDQTVTSGAAGSTNTLNSGTVTYRVYADLLPNYKFQALYGVANHELKISTTTNFFNEINFETATPTQTTTFARQYANLLDSYLSVGASASGRIGVLKAEDTDGALTNLNSMLTGADTSAGTAVLTNDGMITGTPASVTLVGLTTGSAPLNMFEITGAATGANFSTFNASVAALGGTSGPTSSNRVLIGQFTTSGVFSFEFNIQVGTPTGGVQRFVAKNPVGAEISIPSLKGTYGDLAISGLSTVSSCQTGVVYSIPTTTAGSIVWTVPAGVTITAGQGTTSITTSWPSSVTGGISVVAYTPFGSYSANRTVTISGGSGSAPAAPATLTGVTAACANLSTTYTCAASSGATSYTWSSPLAGIKFNGQNSPFTTTNTTVTVTYPATVAATTINVAASNCTGTSTNRSLTIGVTAAAPATPGAITGTTTFVCGQTLTYSIAAVANATSYTWSTNVAGATINGSATATTSATSVSITWPSTMPATGDSIRVVASNCFGNSAVRVLVASAAKPATPGTVTGVNQTTTGASVVAYIAGQTAVYSFAAPVLGAVSYTWSTNVAGATLNGSSSSVTVAATSTGAQSVTVIWPSVVPATGDTLRVVANGNCGSSLPRVLVLTCAKPATPGTITGVNQTTTGGTTTTFVCGQTITYSFAAPAAGATSYTWRTNATGAKINGVLDSAVTVSATSSGAQNVTIEWPSVMPASGISIFVKSNGNCGSSIEKALAVKAAKPATPGVISGQASGVCNSTLTYSIPAAIAGAVSYTWSTNCPGASINGGSTSATVNGLSVSVTWPTDTATTRRDSLRVIANGNCGSSVARVLVVTRIPGTPASITGNAAPCLNADQLYVAAPVVGSTGYFWTYATAGTSYISGQGDDSLTVRFTTAGTKTLTARATNACSKFTNNVPNGTAKTLAVTATSCVRLADINQNAEMLVYPNPASDLATLAFDMQNETNCTVSIIDMLGRVVFAKEIAASAGQNMIDLNVQDLKSGMYSVTLTANGNRSVTRLIVE